MLQVEPTDEVRHSKHKDRNCYGNQFEFSEQSLWPLPASQDRARNRAAQQEQMDVVLDALMLVLVIVQSLKESGLLEQCRSAVSEEALFEDSTHSTHATFHYHDLSAHIP